MKTFTKFFILYFTLVLLISFGGEVVGQSIKTSNYFVQKQSQFESVYMMAHKLYKQQLDPSVISENNYQRNIESDYQFLLDTVYLYTISSSPKRYIYTYSAANFRNSTLTEIIVNGNWEYSTYEAATYDEDGNKLTTLWRRWVDGAFVNIAKDTYTYNVNGDMLSFLREVWENGNWQVANRGTFVFNTGGNLLSVLNEVWDGNEWANYSFELYTYNELGQMLTAVGSLWVNNIWVTDRQHSYTYDANSNLISGLTEMWEDTTWVNFYQETYTYNNANSRLTFTGEFWEADTWVYSYGALYTYDDLGFLTYMVEQLYENNSWVNSRKEFYVYNTYGGYETVLIELWVNSAWVNSSMTLNNYDEYGNTINIQFFNWVDDNWEHTVDGVLKLFYDYSLETEYFTGYLIDACYTSVQVGINESNNNIDNFVCSPNPASGSTTITTTLLNNTVVDINIFDYSGKKVETVYGGMLTAGLHNITLSTEHFNTGMYIVTMVANNETQYFKLIITK